MASKFQPKLAPSSPFTVGSTRPLTCHDVKIMLDVYNDSTGKYDQTVTVGGSVISSLSTCR